MADEMSNDQDSEYMAQVRKEVQEVQTELKTALQEILREAGKRLKPNELVAIKQEFEDLDALLERLKSGRVWIALFGRANVGKSSVANSLMGRDVAVVGIQHDLTTKASGYNKEVRAHDKNGSWVLVDVPGIMGDKVLEDVAVAEAKKALGHIFVIESEPFATEIKLFDVIHEALPSTPKIVFFNKWDNYEGRVSKTDIEMVKTRVYEKMAKYVTSKEDIVFGTARIYDPLEEEKNPESGGWVRQDLPLLLDRLYAGAGTLGQVINLVDPANRAHDLTSRINEKVIEVRVRVARQVINVFSMAAVAGGFVPFDSLTVQPGLLAGLTAILCRIMGKRLTGPEIKNMSIELVKTCGKLMAVEFGALVAADMLASTVGVVLPFLFPIILGEAAALGYYRYRRTAIFGEVALEFIKRDCSWGADGPRTVVAMCRDRANRYYARLRRSPDSAENDATKPN